MSESGRAVALILGAGDSTGAAIGERFAEGGYRVCLARRSGEALTPLVERGRGSIFFTGATASVRGSPHFAAFAGAKARPAHPAVSGGAPAASCITCSRTAQFYCRRVSNGGDMSSLEAELDDNTHAELKRLTSPPPVAWPTVIMLAVSLMIILASYTAGFMRLVPLWAAGLVNMLVMYNLFSVIHDGIHRSISRNQKLNDWCARLAGQGMSPGTVLGLFRWGHIQHHRFTTGEGDPDNWLHGGRWWTMPLRWSVIDLYYLTHAVRTRDKIAAKHLPAAFVGTTFIFTTAGILAALGFWREVLMLWLLPTRLNSILLGFTFF